MRGYVLESSKQSLLERIAAIETLREAWRKVRVNKGGPGADGVTLEAFASDLDERLSTLGRSLLAETYRPGRLLRFAIAKPDGSRRRLAVPSVVDRLAQTAALLVLGPDLDRSMSPASFGYRTGRNVEAAIAAVEMAIGRGFVWTLDADVRSFFDRVPHRRLYDELSIWIGEEAVLRLFALWLRAFSLWGRGIAQGSPISPLLANLFLHPLDRLVAAQGYAMVRYADDFVVLAPSKGRIDAARSLVVEILKRRELTLNEIKTRIVPPGQAFHFLGRELAAPSSTASTHAKH